MNGYEYLARCFKDRDNKQDLDIKIGTVKSLPRLKIQVGEKVTLDRRHIIPLVDLYETKIIDSEEVYVCLNKEILLLRFDEKFIVLGVIRNEKDA